MMPLVIAGVGVAMGGGYTSDEYGDVMLIDNNLEQVSFYMRGQELS